MSKTDIQKNRNKTVVISGSTSGLGKEMSIEFAKRGWVVAGFGKTTKENSQNSNHHSHEIHRNSIQNQFKSNTKNM